jgi:ATP-dependent exoDNAse (exonuclease V) beta subunit
MIPFNHSQSLGLDINRHIALDAGAGTGKTTVMAHRYLQHLLSKDQRATRILPAAPRIPLKGMGAIRCPAKERTALKDWQGLLPTETVAITFTRKAAAELKGRIRRLIASLRAQSPGPEDVDGFHDLRLDDQGDVSMLLSLIDDAPISTIDSFFSALVSPYMGLVCDDPASEQIDDDGAIILREEAIRTGWRLQRGVQAIEAGMSGDIEAFLLARDRLSIRLGGQSASATVVRGMLKKSLFVEEASRRISLNSVDGATVDMLDSLFLGPVEDFIDDWYTEFREYVCGWTDAWLDGGGHFITGADAETGWTRFRFVQRLSLIPADDTMSRLQWIWLVSHAITTARNLGDINCKSLFRAKPPNGEKWPSGVLSKKDNTAMTTDSKNIASVNAEQHASSIREMLHCSRGLLLRKLGQASFLLNPLFDDPEPVPGQVAHPPRLERDLPQIPPSSQMRLTTDLELEVMEDLFVVHDGIQAILSRLKSQEGVRDHDDMHRLAEDLLLARCPVVCRSWYPTRVIDALDSMTDPWDDGHLHRAITASQGDEKVHIDLMRRIDILRDLRRCYRAFIIDEYQDTNPQHFRLLARLWGRRKLERDEPAPPAGPWDPTICIVGDMKQSIYRFRQAEVTVMKRAVGLIRQVNREEALMEARTDDLRQADAALDPRPIPGKTKGSLKFVQGSKLQDEDSQRGEWISFLLDDDNRTIGEQSLAKRREGHIEMKTNYRTLPRLLTTMNYLFEDTFDSRHHLLPGPWHAEAQDLAAGREQVRTAALEWILPARTGDEPRPMDPSKPIDPFLHRGSSNRELAADMMAKRIGALLDGSTAQVIQSEDGSWVDLSEEAGLVRPSDIMILVSSRGRIPLIISTLEAHGIPAMADKQGILMQRPVIQPLMALLWACCSPGEKSAALALGRSVIMGMDDESLILHLGNSEVDQLKALIEVAPTKKVANLIERIHHLASNGDVLGALRCAIDHSDLLYSYPREGDRQDVENWLAIYQQVSKMVGGDAALILARLRRLAELDNDGPKSRSEAAGGAVQVLTVHGAKGLEAPVIIAYDIFATGTRDAAFSSSANVLVTPDIIAGRIHPWRGFAKPQSGLWTLANLMDDGQQRAERRRQFYVALTRARDRLIIVGSPSKGAAIDQSGSIVIERSDGRQNMGQMFLDGLAHSSIEAGNSGCAWSNGGLDQTGATLVLNPGDLAVNGQLPEGCVNGVTIFHHPDCFDSRVAQSPLVRWQNRLDLSNRPSETTRVQNIKQLRTTVPLASHSLDVAFGCRRRYWLGSKLNWRAEKFQLSSESPSEQYWPSATEFGSLFHRLVEIGLANPGSNSTNLDQTWTRTQADRLTDSKTVDEVMAQSSITDAEVFERTKLRLMHLAKLTREGSLGKLSQGQTFDGFKVEGLRTELPFYIAVDHLSGLARTQWTPRGDEMVAKVDQITTTFDGRADLVVALRDESGQGWLQVVDAKTSGCLHAFRPNNAEEGNDIQVVDDVDSPFASTKPEYEIIEQHKLQLALYSLGLILEENQKPEGERRKILPPAILVAASGRMIRMSDEEFQESLLNLEELLGWMGEIAAAGDYSKSPNRLAVEAAKTCEKCPYFSGSIKLCGPVGHLLG